VKLIGNQKLFRILVVVMLKCTFPPKKNTCALKNSGWKMKVPFEMPLFRGVPGLFVSGCFQGNKVMIRCERPVGDLEKLR